MEDVKRLKRGEPLAYVIGWADFLGVKIDLRYKPLIPRPETEFWTERAIAHIKSKSTNGYECNESVKCLDVFAGSGCIGIAVLKHVSQARMDFADISPKALKQIKFNLKLNKIKAGRYQIKHSHILENVRMSYDYIFANPPYIPLPRKKRLSKSVVAYEPHAALFAGKDGLWYIRRFLEEAKNHLKPGGEIWLEFDSGQKAVIEQLAKEYGWRKFKIFKDQFGRFRYAVMLR